MSVEAPERPTRTSFPTEEEYAGQLGRRRRRAVAFKFFALENWTFRDRPRRGWLPFRFVKFNVSAILSPAIVVVTVLGVGVTSDVAGLGRPRDVPGGCLPRSTGGHAAHLR